jgi:hypothetical protein
MPLHSVYVWKMNLNFSNALRVCTKTSLTWSLTKIPWTQNHDEILENHSPWSLFQKPLWIFNFHLVKTLTSHIQISTLLLSFLFPPYNWALNLFWLSLLQIPNPCDMAKSLYLSYLPQFDHRLVQVISITYRAPMSISNSNSHLSSPWETTPWTLSSLHFLL